MQPTTTTTLHTFNGPLSGTTRVSRYQKGKTNLDFTEARVSEWQWHQLGHMQVCTLLQTDNHASTPPLSFFTGQMPSLPPIQQRQSTEGKRHSTLRKITFQQQAMLSWVTLARLKPLFERFCGTCIIIMAKQNRSTNLG